MITDLALPNPREPSSLVPARAEPCHARKSTRFRPHSPIEPARSSSRRVGPSQVWHLRPGITSMASSSSKVVQKRFAVDQRPQEILRAGGPAHRAGAPILQAAVEFRWRGEAAESSQIDFFDKIAIWFAAQD